MIRKFTFFIALLSSFHSFSQSPNISSISNNPTVESSLITILGSDLSTITSISIGSNDISLTAISNITFSQFELQLPNIAAGIYLVNLTAPGGISNSFELTITSNVIPYPTISGLSTSSGEVDDIITINGINFESVSGVFFGNIAVNSSDITPVSNSEIVVKVPVLSTLGNYDVKVHTPIGNSNILNFNLLGFNFPQIGNISPNTFFSGDRVTISGTRFSSITGIVFGTTLADINSLIKIDDSKFSILTPFLTPGNHAVAVSNVRGEGNSSNITVSLPSPTISTIEPVNIRVGDKITITGSNFLNPVQVIFNVVTIEGVRLISNTQLEVAAPNGLASGNITLKTPYGATTSMQTVSVSEILGERPDNVTSNSSELFSDFNHSRIYPNPSSGSFYIEAIEPNEISINNTAGNLIFLSKTSTSKTLFNLPLPKGIYYVKIGTSIKKLIIE